MTDVNMFQIYLSVFFILPMFLWISCQPTEDRNTEDGTLPIATDRDL